MDVSKSLTLRILDGIDKGKSYENLPFPIRIGREPQNEIVLHDEKVSRYHCRIQLDGEEILLTDIDSTNGTRLNGQAIHVATLHYGDLIAVGQTLIIAGTRKEITRRLALLDDLDLQDVALRLISGDNSPEVLPPTIINEMENYSYDVMDAMARLHGMQPPKLPADLKPAQLAELADMFLYFQLRMRLMIDNARPNGTTNRVSWNQREWQSFLDLFSRISDYYNKLVEPDT